MILMMIDAAADITTSGGDEGSRVVYSDPARLCQTKTVAIMLWPLALAVDVPWIHCGTRIRGLTPAESFIIFLGSL